MKKKRVKKTASDSNELKSFLNHNVEVQFKTPMAMLSNGQVMLGISGFLIKATSRHLYLADVVDGEVTTLIEREVVSLINKTIPENVIFNRVDIPQDPEQGH